MKGYNSLDIRKMTKEERIKRAHEHTEFMETHYREWIDFSERRSFKYTMSDFDELVYEARMRGGRETGIFITDKTSVEQIFDIYYPRTKIAVLNFASFKHPGGMFLEGSSAQEESLCHSSYLYNVLRRFEDKYYKNHLNALNNALYRSEVLYTKNVTFMDYDENGYLLDMAHGIDVITCAAPNTGTYTKYHKDYDIRTIETELKDRINLILSTAAVNGTNVLILGAFGCGVFKNDPHLVAEIFYDLLTGFYEGIFDYVFFPIPDGKDGNYKVFHKVFEEDQL